ncbi:hypothetical protein F4861DRAFT_544755 [Xylaria intraflava]|nr:hypothetical protein F4861DRAFT_544755 [Xylaria intraflava]
MVRSVHTERVSSGCRAVLSSWFKTKSGPRSPVTNGPSDGINHLQNSDIEMARSEMSLIVTDALGAISPNPSDTLDTPTPPVENEELSQKQENDLWRRALEKIDEGAKKQISGEFDQSGDENPVTSLIRIVQDQEARFTEKSAKIKVGEREIIWRDYAARVTDGLTVLGDVAIHFAPGPSSIIWSALKVLLKAHVSECESLVAMLGCATRILPLVRCGAIYEKVYLKDISDESEESAANLREAIINIYAKVFQVLARAKHYLNQNSAVRFLHALLNLDESEELLQALDKAEMQLASAVQACQSVQTQNYSANAQKLLQSLDKPLRHIDERVKIILERVSADDRFKLLDTFSKVAFGDQHIRRTKSRTEGTGTWLLKHQKFRDWEISSSSSILWLTGTIGAGKSVLASNVVDRYWVEDTSRCEPIDEGFAFFYYSKNDQELKGDPIAHILGSFLRQLATVPHYPAEVYTGLIILRHRMEERKITFDAKHCKEILSHLVDLLPRTFIILDGLDEFENSSDIREIIRFFVELVKKSERPVKIFISSRGEPSIREELLRAKGNLTQITILDKSQPDIKEFVQKRTREIGRWWSPELKQKVETTLCDLADGMFRWVYLQIEHLANINSPEAVLERLKKLPRGLKEAYDELYNANDGWDQVCLQRAVKWVMYARKPFSTEELISAVRLGHNGDSGEPRLEIASRLNEPALEKICRHLIVKDPQGHWKFPHASVEEYFRGEQHKSWISDDVQIELAKLSLLLLIKTFQDWILPESNYEAEALIYVARAADKKDRMTYILDYVIQHWVSHIGAIQGEVDECISQLLKRFMIAQDGQYHSGSAYMAWARYVDLMNKDPEINGWAGPHLLSHIEPIENPAFGIAALNLHIAAKQWGEDCLRLNVMDDNDVGYDLLTVAAQYAHPELCVKLIELGSDVNRILPSGSSALLKSIENHRLACARILLEHGADPNLGTDTHALCEATADSCLIDMFELLLSYNANPNAMCPDCHYGCALEATANGDNEEIAEFLIEAGAIVDLRTGSRFGSPLAAAAFMGAQKVVELLIRRGADVHAHLETGEYGGVLTAAFCGWTGAKNVVVYLIEKAGADPRRIMSDLAERSPWMGLDKKKRQDIAIYLISHGHLTLDDLRSLGRGPVGPTMFHDDFISSLESAETAQALIVGHHGTLLDSQLWSDSPRNRAGQGSLQLAIRGLPHG